MFYHRRITLSALRQRKWLFRLHCNSLPSQGQSKLYSAWNLLSVSWGKVEILYLNTKSFRVTCSKSSYVCSETVWIEEKWCVSLHNDPKWPSNNNNLRNQWWFWWNNIKENKEKIIWWDVPNCSKVPKGMTEFFSGCVKNTEFSCDIKGRKSESWWAKNIS
jgi:hypothetical protein